MWPAFGRAHDGVYEFKTTAVSAGGPLTLQVVLDHQTTFERHLIGRFRLSACSAKNASQEILLRPPPAIDPARVDQAIQRGIAWLRTAPFPADWSMGANELTLWTFVHAGVPESDVVDPGNYRSTGKTYGDVKLVEESARLLAESSSYQIRH